MAIERCWHHRRRDINECCRKPVSHFHILVEAIALRYRVFKQGFVLVAGWLVSLAAFAGESQAAVQALKERLQQTDALRGNFEQTLFDRDGHALQKTQGEFVVQRPGNFYWETYAPYEQLVVGNGDRLWVYDPDLEQVTVHRQDQQQQMSPAQLLSGELDDLDKHYQVSRERLNQEAGKTVDRFLLESADRNGLFARLQLVYQNDALAALKFEDNMGQVTALSFSNLETDPKIDPALFRFDVPEGVDVIVDD
jgi:outer membrane lipoprotein carrier protein